MTLSFSRSGWVLIPALLLLAAGWSVAWMLNLDSASLVAHEGDEAS